LLQFVTNTVATHRITSIPKDFGNSNTFLRKFSNFIKKLKMTAEIQFFSNQVPTASGELTGVGIFSLVSLAAMYYNNLRNVNGKVCEYDNNRYEYRIFTFAAHHCGGGRAHLQVAPHTRKGGTSADGRAQTAARPACGDSRRVHLEIRPVGAIRRA
jgi:hypothetical protein